MYKTWCETCKRRDEAKIKEENKEETPKVHVYIGETSRSAFERGYEHLDDIQQLKPNSHLLLHLLDKHEGEMFNEVDLRMEVLAYPRTAYERQILEAVLIQQNKHQEIMNSRSEYNRSAIPRLGLKLGEKEFNERMKEEKEEEEREETLKEKVRELRRLRNKERGGFLRGGPNRKKRKLNPNNEDYLLTPNNEEDILKNLQTLVTTTTTKRKEVTPDEGNIANEERRPKQRKIVDFLVRVDHVTPNIHNPSSTDYKTQPRTTSKPKQQPSKINQNQETIPNHTQTTQPQPRTPTCRTVLPPTPHLTVSPNKPAPTTQPQPGETSYRAAPPPKAALTTQPQPSTTTKKMTTYTEEKLASFSTQGLELYNWEAERKKCEEKLENERKEKERLLKKARNQQMSWEMLRWCKSFIKENTKSWQEMESDKESRKKDIEKKERLQIGQNKKKEILRKQAVQSKITDTMKRLPLQERNIFQKEERKINIL